MTITSERPSTGAEAPAGATGAVTVASLARDWAHSSPRQVAMREKDFGIWQEYDWAATWDLVEAAAHGLLELGVDVGDRVAIHSEDRPEWVILDCGRGGGARRHCGPLPDQPHGGGRVPAQRLLAGRVLRRGPGAGRQGAGSARRGGSVGAAHHLHRAPRLRRLHRRAAAVLGHVPGDGPPPPRSPSRRGRRAHGRRHRRRRDDAGVHVRHDRPAQGRHAHQRQRRLLHRQDRQRDRPLPRRHWTQPQRPDRHLPAAVPCGGADLLDLDPRRRRAVA